MPEILTWRRLKHFFFNISRYKKITDNNGRSGRDNWRWQYFVAMDKIMGDDPSIVPPVTVSSLSGRKGECIQNAWLITKLMQEFIEI